MRPTKEGPFTGIGATLHKNCVMHPFEKLKGDPDHIAEHLVSYINGFSANVRTIFDFFEFEAEIEKMREANIPLLSSLSSAT